MQFPVRPVFIDWHTLVDALASFAATLAALIVRAAFYRLTGPPRSADDVVLPRGESEL